MHFCGSSGTRFRIAFWLLHKYINKSYVSILPEPILAASITYAYAVDLDRPVTVAAFECMKKSGYKAAIIRAYDPSNNGKFDVNAVNNIRNANQAGLGTEVFMTPLPRSSKKGGKQFKELYEGLKNGKIDVRTVWLQVTSPINWGSNSNENIYFLNDIIAMAKYYGVRIGFYTNVYDWNQITKGATVEGAMLWYWNVNGGGPSGETPANFDDFRPFGKFTKPTMKQFGQMEQICGVTVNRDIYFLEKSNPFPTEMKGKQSDELIVGKLGHALTGFLSAA
ncbi:unnamed protein product [Cylicocyclus nassatus]|uniref:Uncharacterized protein n=1 Tax=Cylicocyclus nassatus TaxID=53992 RepID=A0AA36GVD5_CYLNA|nr:unnamed protein product [Cylicocyclus nassatus]